VRAPFESIGWQCVSEVLPDCRQGPNLRFSGIKTGTNRASNPFRYGLIFGSPEYQANQLVIRSRDLRKNPSSREIVDFSIIDDAIEYAHDAAGTPYNYLFDLPTKVAGAIRSLLKKDQNARFGSELAAKILRKNHAWTLSPEQPGQHTSSTSAATRGTM
jgi:hypothetical protein